MPDLSQAVKAAILARLDADAAVTAIVPAGQIFPLKVEAKPAYPFIRYDPPTNRAYESTCGAGSEMLVRISAFTIGEDAMQTLSAVIVAALDNMPGFQQCDWTGTQLIPDPEADVFHAAIDFTVVHTA